ncbi:MAG: response regulator [Thermoanaerobaculia bacterium]
MNDIVLYCLNEKERDFITEVLQKEGYKVNLCSSLLECEELISQTKANLCILDSKLKEGDGFSAVRILREKPRTRNISYVIKINPEDITQEEMIAQGINDFLLEPVTKNDLIKITKKLINIPKRIVFQALIQIKREGQILVGKTLNISQTGVLVQVAKPLEVGETVEISFFIPKSRVRLQTKALVKRKASERIYQMYSYGLEYIEPPQEVISKIKEID